MSDTIEDLKARLERTQKRLAIFEDLYLCKRCGSIGHDMETCMQESMPLDEQGNPLEVDPDDVFIHSKVDRRIIDHLATEMWQLAMSYLPVHDVVPHVPRTCKYLNGEVVWGKWSGRLMWLEMAPGPEGVDARVFKVWSGENPPSRTALIRACEKGAPVAHVSALLAGGAAERVNAVDRYRQTALYLASERGDEGIVRALLGANADPNIADYAGSTPLMQASYCGHSAVVSALIEAKPGATLSVNHADIGGWTALMRACSENHVDCVRVLVAERARTDVTMRDGDGETALDIARRHGHHEIVQLLEQCN